MLKQANKSVHTYRKIPLELEKFVKNFAAHLYLEILGQSFLLSQM